MKAKKFMAAISAIVMSTTMCLSVVGCKDKHTHSVADSDWKISTAPTCEADGEETGLCDCGEQLTRKVEALGHKYGDWQIVKPTADAAGKATKVCGNDGSHNVEVVLPAIKNSGNKYQVKGDGVAKTYTLTHELGNVEFTQYLVSDATAAASENADSVIKGDVDYSNVKYSYAASNGVANPNEYNKDPVVTDSKLSYELGDGCAHYTDDSAYTDTWYAETESGIFSYLTFINSYNENENKPVTDVDGDVLKGFPLGFTYYGKGHKEAGLERYIEYLYGCAVVNPNNDFKEEVKEVDGKIVYSFSFSELQDVGSAPQHVDPNIDLGRSLYLHINEVEFVLNDDNIAESATVTNTLYMILFNEEVVGSSKWVATPQIEQLDDETWRVKDEWKGKPMNVQKFTFRQQSVLAEGESKPVLPIQYDDLFAQSFDLYTETINNVKFKVTQGDNGQSLLKIDRDENGNLIYGYTEINDQSMNIVSFTPSDSKKYNNEVLSINPGESLYFSLRNVSPSTANFNYDDIKFYLRTSSGDELLQFNYEGGEDGHIKVGSNPVFKTLSLNFYLAGEHEVVIKTTNCEKVVKVKVNPVAPAKLNSLVYEYDEVKEQESWNNLIKDFTVYAGQPLYFTSQVLHPAYEIADFTATISGESEAVLTDDKKGDVSVKKFVADKDGFYTVTLASTANNKATSKIRITVLEAPDVANVFNTEYENTDKSLPVSLTLTPSAEGATAGTASLEIGGDTTTFNYAYVDGEVKVTNINGALSAIGLKLTEGYKLVLTYTEGPNNTHKVLLKDVKEVVNELLGAHNLVSKANAEEFDVKVEGKYTISHISNGLYKYNLNGTDSEFQIGSTTLTLKVGDKLKIYNDVAAEGDMFVVTYKAIQESSGYGFAETQWKATINSYYNLTITFDSENSGSFIDSMSNSDTFTFTETDIGDGKHKLTFSCENNASWFLYDDMVNTDDGTIYSYFTVKDGKVDAIVLVLDDGNFNSKVVTLTKIA